MVLIERLFRSVLLISVLAGVVLVIVAGSCAMTTAAIFTRGTIAIGAEATEPQALGNAVEDVDTVVYTTEKLLARSAGEDGHVGERVDLRGRQTECDKQ